MKFNQTTVFLVLFGLLLAFCLACNVKSKFTEAMTEASSTVADSDASQNLGAVGDLPEERVFDTNAYPDNRQRVKRTTGPEHMARDQKVAFEAMTTMTNTYGSCTDNAAVYKTDASGSNCYGYCPTNKDVYKIDASGTNCVAAGQNCAACSYGMCTDGTTCKSDAAGTNCSQYPPPLPKTCATSTYGCCPDNQTSKNETGSNCNCPAVVQPTEMAAGIIPFNTSTVFIPPPAGVPSSPAPAPGPAPAPAPGPAPGPAPSSTSCSCPEPEPCPACARCPEAAFQCKKVPNYERTDNERYVPQAILTDFSSFGM